MTTSCCQLALLSLLTLIPSYAMLQTLTAWTSWLAARGITASTIGKRRLATDLPAHACVSIRVKFLALRSLRPCLRKIITACQLLCRILAGWVPGSERVTLGLSDLAPPAAGSAPVTRRYTLWPYDRPESKGQLKGVTLRVEDGKVLVLGYRWGAYETCSCFWGVLRRCACQNCMRTPCCMSSY